MRAAYIRHYGSRAKLTIGDVPEPSMGDRDVLIQIHSASLNPIDFKIRNGSLRFLRRDAFPLVLGHDLAGIVTAVGRNATRFRTGDRVFSRPRNGRIGTLAEFIAVDETDVAPMPKSLDFDDAASLPLVGLTSWQALVDTAKVGPGDRVFIQAGSGGIGTFAIQLAKHLGAYVSTTTSERNFELVRSLGADELIDYRTVNFKDVLKELDVVFDTLGGDALYQSFHILRPGGWLVSIAGEPNADTARDLSLGWFKSLVLAWVGRKVDRLARSSAVNYRFLFVKPRGDQLSEIGSLVDQGKIRPVIDRCFSLAQAQEAMEYLESGRVRGKVIVRICS